MRRSFQIEIAVFTALVSGVTMLAFGMMAWWWMQGQFLRSIDARMQIPGERLITVVGPGADGLELFVEYTNLSANHEFHLRVVGNDGNPWYTSPGAAWMETIELAPYLPSVEALERVWERERARREREQEEEELNELARELGLPGVGPPAGGPPGRGFRRSNRSGPRPIAPMVFGSHRTESGAEYRLGGVSNRDITVIMALNPADFDADLQRWRQGFFLALPVALLAVSGGGWLVSRRAVKPLRRVARTAGRLNASELSERIALTGKEPGEVAELIEVLNAMMDRLERGFTQATRFTADASHELKTPIALVQAGIESALAECQAQEADPTVLMDIAQEVRRLKGILEGLLLLSRADAGRLRLVDERVDLSRELTLLQEDIELMGTERQLDVQFSLVSGVTVVGDAILLRQAMQNLLSNAVKYNEPGGQLWCSLSVDSGWAVVLIGNSGKGIPEADRERIFDRFYRVDPSRSRAVDGFGLGLNIALEVVKAHSGRLFLHTADRERTVFQLQIPLAVGEGN